MSGPFLVTGPISLLRGVGVGNPGVGIWGVVYPGRGRLSRGSGGVGYRKGGG